MRGPFRAGRCRSSFDDVRFHYPTAAEVSLASLESVAREDALARAATCCAASPSRLPPAR